MITKEHAIALLQSISGFSGVVPYVIDSYHLHRTRDISTPVLPYQRIDKVSLDIPTGVYTGSIYPTYYDGWPITPLMYIDHSALEGTTIKEIIKLTQSNQDYSRSPINLDAYIDNFGVYEQNKNHWTQFLTGNNVEFSLRWGQSEDNQVKPWLVWSKNDSALSITHDNSTPVTVAEDVEIMYRINLIGWKAIIR